MFNEVEVMDELDKFFDDNEKSKKRYKLLMQFGLSSKYGGKELKLEEPKKKEIKKKVIKIHKKGKPDNDNIF